MNIDTSQIPDWALLDRYVAGECTPGERARVASWLETSLEAQAVFAGLRDGARAALPPHRSSLLSSPTPLAPRVSHPITRRSWWGWYAEGAAMALLLVVGGWYWAFQHTDSQTGSDSIRIATTATQERARIQLPDGSSVLLAPESELRYSASFGDGSRTVTLRGAALFTVTHADAAPFIVATDHAQARVLGTSFTVRQYDEEETMRVVVASGRVGVGSAVLSSGDAVSVVAGGTSQISHAVNVAAELAWTHGRLEFRSEPLRNVIPELERWYGMRIEADSSLLKKTVTMSLTTESRREVVRLLTVLLGVEAREHDEQITLLPR